MIRIDEIYQHTIVPWFLKHRPGHRVLFCDPFGRSDPDSIISYGDSNLRRFKSPDHNYTFFFDQEPIHLNIHIPTFNKVKDDINYDLHDWFFDREFGSIVTSEKDSDNVDYICKKYGWESYYYFFHGWAALDWYRGYDKTFLITPPEKRKPTKTFISPNRIIAGERKHRLEMLYWIFKLGLTDNHISCPTVCPAENISIYDAVKSLPFDDVDAVFELATLPIQFAGETDHPMHSCWLSLFDEAADSLLYLVTETVADGRRLHLTEKTFKPIALGMPFVLVSTAGSLEYLRSYGFKTFGHIWDESYDTIADPHQRIAAVAGLLKNLCSLSVEERIALFHLCHETIEHNWNHFYNGGFEAILWDELRSMLESFNAKSSV